MSGKSEQERIDAVIDEMASSSPRLVDAKPDPSIVPAAKRRTATYNLREDTIAQIKAVTQQERFSGKQYSVIVQAMIDFAITEYWADRAEVVMVTESDGFRRPTMKRKNVEDSTVKPA